MSAAARFRPADLIEQACHAAGCDDFGEDSWREGLDRVCDGLINQARLNALGVEIASADLVRALTHRLQITAWRGTHPEVATAPVERPIVIVGQPRTGTTILFDLLATDPALRAPLTWEVDNPHPLPDPREYETDPASPRPRPPSRCRSRSCPACWCTTRWGLESARNACA